KVERGLNDIGVNDFLEILQKHNVDPQEFFDEFKGIKNNKKTVTALMNKLVRVANEDNDVAINSIINKLNKITPQTPFIKFAILQAKLISNTHDVNALSNLTNSEKKQIKKVIFQRDTEENEYYRLILITNIIQIYSIEESNFLISSIIRRYKDTDNLDRKTVVVLGALMINFVDWSYRKDKKEFCYLPLSYLRSLPNIIEVAFPKILGVYFENKIGNKYDEANEIKNILKKAGYDTFVNKMNR
ncbi:MAG: hypothetical protein M3036_17085, partial [Bifidobacteriales bacterium]|nr:hypothetical protein [Bifidobacteriales bacterium]